MSQEEKKSKQSDPNYELPFVEGLFPPVCPSAESFAPAADETDGGAVSGEASFARSSSAFIPDQAGCSALWSKYKMLPNIREHSSQVAFVVSWLGAQLEAKGVNVNRPLIFAGALLHDLAKTYTIYHGGSHAQLGAAWVLRETGNYKLAQMVFHHVHWPWELDIDNESMLAPLLVVYADKRVKHNRIVSLEERFEDLFVRYGVSEAARQSIALSREQGLIIERALSERLGVAVDEYTFDCRRLV